MGVASGDDGWWWWRWWSLLLGAGLFVPAVGSAATGPRMRVPFVARFFCTTRLGAAAIVWEYAARVMAWREWEEATRNAGEREGGGDDGEPCVPH